MPKRQQRARSGRAAKPKISQSNSRPPGNCSGINDKQYGWFEGCVHACWLDDGRYMALLKPLVFHQTRGNKTWTAPAGTVTDGATIPPVFWTAIGGPFEDRYRDAAVNHDYECCVQQNPWRDVHRMFYDAMMTRGVEPWRAKLMYFAVYHTGPSWPKTERRPRRGFSEGDIARAAHLFKKRRQMQLEDIETLTPEDLRARVPAKPAYIEGAAVLDDTKKIRAVSRTAPCTTSVCA